MCAVNVVPISKEIIITTDDRDHPGLLEMSDLKVREERRLVVARQ